MYLQKYILHLHKYFTNPLRAPYDSTTHVRRPTGGINTIINISLKELRNDNMQRTSAIEFFATCFFRGMMANFDINLYIFAREILFHSCKIDRAPYGFTVKLSPKNK